MKIKTERERERERGFILSSYLIGWNFILGLWVPATSGMVKVPATASFFILSNTHS
jgi:hypothetical protein